MSLQAEIFKREPFASAEQEAALSIIRTADALSRPVETLLAGFGLSTTQYNVLRILRGSGEEGLPCGQIVQHMITREPDMTRLLDRLERRELISRCRPSCDRRVVRAKLTPAAIDLLAQIDEPLMKLHQLQFSRFDAQQLSSLIQLLAVARGGLPKDSTVTTEGSL